MSGVSRLEKTVEQMHRDAFEPRSQTEDAPIPQDAVEFAKLLFNFTPKEYQAKLLQDDSKRIVVRWSRQAGKTTCIALRAIWFALTHDKTLTLIVAPSLRQSMIMSDRIWDFLGGLPSKYKRLITRLQRTTVRFKNGSRIVALPNSPQLLRGYTANQVITDESGFFENDQLVFCSVRYPMLSTTEGTLIASSTPWSKDSVFYQMCQSSEFNQHVCTCDDVVRSGQRGNLGPTDHSAGHGNDGRHKRVNLEPGYIAQKQITVHSFLPTRVHDKIRYSGEDHEVITVSDYDLDGDPLFYKSVCRRLITQ